MNCPTCKSINLVMSERQGIEIDYCPQCRGVWLDRGELDKIIEKSVATSPVRNTESNIPQPSMPNYSHQQSHHNDGYYKNDGHYKKKKEGFLSDLFDF
ncbi:MAG: zf-TFIIB domain-containing protein [Pseudomonadota bacterium]